jgi:hypothetical protein
MKVIKTRSGIFICLIVIVLLSGTTPSYGQFALGVRLGYNASKLTTNVSTISSDFNSGFHVSVWTHFGKRLYFAPEFGYTLSGGVLTNKGGVDTTMWKQKITVGSLDIPLLLGFKIIHSDAITWRVELGPEASFCINKKVKDMNSVTGPVTTDDINNTNWFLMAGTGIDFLFLNFDIRYQYGLNHLIHEVNEGDQVLTLNTTGGLLSLSLGIKIFGKK